MLIAKDRTLFNGPARHIITKHHANTFGNAKPCTHQPQKGILGSKSAHAGIYAAFQPSGMGAGFGHWWKISCLLTESSLDLHSAAFLKLRWGDLAGGSPSPVSQAKGLASQGLHSLRVFLLPEEGRRGQKFSGRVCRLHPWAGSPRQR